MSLLDTIRKEATEIEQEAWHSAVAHRLDSRKWQKLNVWTGIPATILAAVAGVTAFNEAPKMATGGVAMFAAAITAVATFLGPSDRGSAHRTSSASFNAIRRSANLLRDVHTELVNPEDESKIADLVNEIEELTSKLTAVEHSAPTLSTRARKRAKREIDG